MKPLTKLLFTVWMSATTTLAIAAIYILSQEERINAPGELGEVFATTAFIVLIGLTIFSVFASFLGRNK